MNPIYFLFLILAYLILLTLVSYFTTKGKKVTNLDYFKSNNQANWVLVSIGMVGASLSGITFISVPGWVSVSQFSYFQMVLGYIAGYFVVWKVLIPLYYRYNVTSIYNYLGDRFGKSSYKIGASFFLLSRLIGASLRIYIVVFMLYNLFFKDIGVPFPVVVIILILFIWIYTHRGGIKTIIWTDFIQTFFMLAALFSILIYLYYYLDIPSRGGLFDYFSNHSHSQIFFWDWKNSNFFFKQFLGGMFITIVMTGLDQDMMQKNLACKNKEESQKNIKWFTIMLVLVNFVFLFLGLFLFDFSQENGIVVGKTDLLFQTVATYPIIPKVISMFFVIGLIAAAFSSADSALTALNTSFCIDILNFKKHSVKKQERIRKTNHVLISCLILGIVILGKYFITEQVIKELFTLAGYTYGPLLGLFAFGIVSPQKIIDKYTPFLCIASPIITWSISKILLHHLGYIVGFELILLNGFITFGSLYLIRKK